MDSSSKLDLVRENEIDLRPSLKSFLTSIGAFDSLFSLLEHPTTSRRSGGSVEKKISKEKERQRERERETKNEIKEKQDK